MKQSIRFDLGVFEKHVLTLGKPTKRSIWKEYFGDLHNIDTQKQVAVHMCGFDGIRRGGYFE